MCYTAKHKNQKYCSPLCFLKRNELPIKYCVICKKPFRPQSRKTMCCSIGCAKIKEGNTKRKYQYKSPGELKGRARANYIQNNIRNIRTKKDKKYRLTERVRLRIRQSLNGAKNGKSWNKLVGYNIDDLKKHIEKQFHDGMSWDNYGDWHIDHKIPIAVFNFTKPEHIDFKRCWALKNLQPMWAKDNISKGATIKTHFQPSLPI